MAKIPFSKLQATINNKVVQCCFYDKNGAELQYEVKQYLSLKDKIEMIQNIINQSIDDNGFYNPMRVKLYMTLEIVYNYTNLSFTEKQKEDPFKLYDLLMSTGIFMNIIDSMDASEWSEIQDDVWSTIKNIYDYRNSVLGILETVANDHDNLQFDAEAIKAAIGDPNNLTLLKDVLSKLG